MQKKKYKWITIKESKAGTFDDKPVYIITNNKSGDELGTIFWYKYFKQYVSNADPDAVFSASCHTDIADFMRGLE